MSFGQELKDFTSAFKTGYSIGADSRDKKYDRERNAVNDPIDNDYKKAMTESTKLRNKWYEPIADLELRRGEKDLEWADEKNRSAIDANDAAVYRTINPGRSGKVGEALDADAPEGAPDGSGAPVGYGGPGAVESDSGPAIDTGEDGDQSSLEDTWLKYANANATRNQPLDPKLKNALSFLPDMGVQAVVFSGGQPARGLARIGSHRHDNGRSADVVFMKGGRQLDWARDEDRPIFEQIVSKAKERGVTGIGAGPGYMRQGSMHVGFGSPAVWGAGGKGENAPDWLKSAYYGNGYSRGGLVVHAARGGAIPELNDPEEEDMPPPGAVRLSIDDEPQPQQVAQALPVEAPVPQQRPMDQEVTPEGNKPDVGYDPAVASDPRVVGFTKAHEAVLDGMRYSLKEAGLGGRAAVTDPDRARKMSQFLKGAGAAPKEIIDQAYDAVDPDKELPESERTMAALGTVYDHYIKRGEPEKAKAAAASIVQYQRKLFQQYATIAKAAIADGDIDAGAKAAVKAYSAVPDGQDLKVKKLENGRYQIELTDEATGKVISKPVLTPQEIGGWAMKVHPGSFDQYIMEAAGVRKQSGGAPSEDFQKIVSGLDEGKLPSNKDMAALPLSEQKEIRQRVEDYNKAQAEGEGGAKPPSYTESNAMREAMKTKFDEVASEVTTDAQGNEEPMQRGMAELSVGDKDAIIDASSDIMGSPNNRSADYNVSEGDAIVTALLVSQADEVKATDKGKGKLVELPDGREVWVPNARFNQLRRIHMREVAEARKAEKDRTAAEKDAASKSKAANERAAQRERDNPAFMAPPGSSTESAVPAGRWDLPLGAPQKALDDLEKLMGQ